jgi:hypothetical protein
MTKQPPEVPQNVRVVLPGGTEVPVEVRYRGWYDDQHRFEAIYPVECRLDGLDLRIGVLPVRTAVALRQVPLRQGAAR